jgi:spore coat protein CotF
VNINIHIQRKNITSKVAKKARKRIQETNKINEMQLKRASKKTEKEKQSGCEY